MHTHICPYAHLRLPATQRNDFIQSSKSVLNVAVIDHSTDVKTCKLGREKEHVCMVTHVERGTLGEGRTKRKSLKTTRKQKEKENCMKYVSNWIWHFSLDALVLSFSFSLFFHSLPVSSFPFPFFSPLLSLSPLCSMSLTLFCSSLALPLCRLRQIQKLHSVSSICLPSTSVSFFLTSFVRSHSIPTDHIY